MQQHEEQQQYHQKQPQQHQASKDNTNLNSQNTRNNDGLMMTTIQTQQQQQPIAATTTTTPTKSAASPKSTTTPTFVFSARRSIGISRVKQNGFNSSAATTTNGGGGTSRIQLDDIMNELMNMREDEYEHHDLITKLHKTVGTPKAALKNDYYGRRKLIPTYMDSIYKTFYHSWCDQNPQNHLLSWTSIFVCPVTGELFPSGRWSYHHERPPTQSCYNYCSNTTSNNANTTITTSYWWFPRKNFAEDGAAARCFDCKVHRERDMIVQRELQRPKPRSVGSVVQIGLEEPYLEQDGLLAIPTADYHIVPPDVRTKIQQQQLEILARIRQEKTLPSSSIVPNTNPNNTIQINISKQPKQNDDDTSATQELKLYDGCDDDDDDD